MSAEKALIFQVQRLSTEDGPGIRTSVFFKHCPLKCVWCHNPESILKEQQLEWFKHKCIGCNSCINVCKQKALSFKEEGLHIDREKCIICGECTEECPSTALHIIGKWWSLDDVFHEIEKDKVYYIKSGGGITVSGGEPTLKLVFVSKFLKMCKENGISTALDTCGYANQAVLEKLLPHVDLILLDIKEIDSKKHQEFTGVPNEKILKNAIWLVKHVENNEKKMWIRTPLIPGYTATEENIKGIGEFIVSKLENKIERWDLLSFNNLCVEKYSRLDMDWALKDVILMTKDEIEKLVEIGKQTGVKNVQWSGLTKRIKNKDEKLIQADKSELPSC